MSVYYEATPSEDLRFGDVIVGFPIATPAAHSTKFDLNHSSGWTLAIANPSRLIVMTPCCSIENKNLVLAPLQEIRPSFLSNPYFKDDLLRINQKVAPENSVPPQAWANMPEGEKTQRMARGKQYCFQELFIYPPHDLLATYRINVKGTGQLEMSHFMVDFKAMYRVDCKLIDRGLPSPSGMKLLELTATARQSLRDKASLYFGRVPDEDQVVLG